MNYSDACQYAAELGIPDEAIEDVVAKAELCCGDEVCVDNSKAVIESEAERFNDRDFVNSLIKNERQHAEVSR